MKSNILESPLKLYDPMPKWWKTRPNTPHYHTLPPAEHYKDSWRDYVAPEYDPATHKTDELIYDEGKDVVTNLVIPITDEEFKAMAESEKQSKQAQLLDEKKTEQALASFQTITDEAEALAVKEVYPDWSVEEDYLKRLAGYKVTRTLKGSEGYEVRLFALIQPHTPQVGYEPENTPALWSEIKMQGETEVWTQPTGGDGKYVFGAVVIHKGQTWENTHPAPSLNVWEPGVFGWTVKA